MGKVWPVLFVTVCVFVSEHISFRFISVKLCNTHGLGGIMSWVLESLSKVDATTWTIGGSDPRRLFTHLATIPESLYSFVACASSDINCRWSQEDNVAQKEHSGLYNASETSQPQGKTRIIQSSSVGHLRQEVQA